MRRLLLSLLIIYFLLVPPGYSTAQSGLPADCKPADLMATLPSLKSTGDPVKDLATLQNLNAQLDTTIAKCNGLHFAAKNAKVIGPILLEKGIYKTTLTTKGYFMANLKVVEGACEVAGLTFYILSTGQADDGAENLITSSGCTALITTENVTAPWTLTLEKIG